MYGIITSIEEYKGLGLELELGFRVSVCSLYNYINRGLYRLIELGLGFLPVSGGP